MAITNRDLYQRVSNIETERSLEDYLLALWNLGCARSDDDIEIDAVDEMLFDALAGKVPDFDDEWRERFPEAPEPTGLDFTDWENTILFQIVDLRRMDEGGQLDDPEKFFGITSPSGAHWYNFDPLTYLECAVRGMVGGYEAEEVVVLIPSEDGNDDSPVFELDGFGWEQFTELLWFGQYYE